MTNSSNGTTRPQVALPNGDAPAPKVNFARPAGSELDQLRKDHATLLEAAEAVIAFWDPDSVQDQDRDPQLRRDALQAAVRLEATVRSLREQMKARAAIADQEVDGFGALAADALRSLVDALGDELDNEWMSPRLWQAISDARTRLDETG